MATSVGEYISVTVKEHGSPDKWLHGTVLSVKSALKAMADATLQRAQVLAPMSNIEGHAGTLRTTGLVESADNGYTQKVQFGNGIPYARYQEFGDPGWNYTTPGTGPQYLKQAGDAVAKEGLKNYL